MEHEDYLNCGEYEGKPKHPKEPEFTSFFEQKSSRYFFALLDADGKVLLKSEGYPQEAACENGIQSVKKNRTNREFYSVKKDTDGTFYLSLRAANYREIARSCNCKSEAEANELLPYAMGEKIRTSKSVVSESVRAEDDYLVCGEYRGHAGAGAEYPGLVKFTHRNGQHYFAWYDDNGTVLMRSEGYPTTAARDNGMASVAKNRDIEERFGIEKVRNFSYVVLKAGNRQEIARSCPYESEEAAKMIFPSRRRAPSVAPTPVAAPPPVPVAPPPVASVAAAAVIPPPPAFTDKEDDYLHCKEYKGHVGGVDGIARFKHSNGQQYFVWYDARGEVQLRSEGHPREEALQRELDLVLKYRGDRERYQMRQVGSFHYATLHTPSGEEIARSCPYATLEDVYAAFPVLAVRALVPPLPAHAPLTESSLRPLADKEDDYLHCKEYRGHGGAVNGIARFKHSNGLQYFVWYDSRNEVLLRSEGHPRTEELQRELDLVMKYRFDKDRYEIKQVGMFYYGVLRAPSGEEIGRSCPFSKLEDVYASFPLLAPVVQKDRDDDYLRCEDYEGHKWVNDKYPDMAMFTHSNGKHYFAVMQKNGRVLLRGEGQLTKDEVYRDMDLVKKFMNEKSRYEVKDFGGKYIYILRDDKGTEIARSCPLTDRAAFPLFAPAPAPSVAAPAAATVAAVAAAATFVKVAAPEVKATPPPPPPVKVAPPPPPKVSIPEPPPIPKAIPPEPVAAGGKFPWWMLAIPLVALAAWWLWPKGSVPTPTPPAVTEAPIATPEPLVVEPKREVLHWIFFDFNRADLRTASRVELDKMASILKEHPEMTGLLRAHTDWKGSDVYNIQLSQRRADAAKRYLVAQGIEGSRVATEISGEQDPIAKNEESGKDTEQGRQFNRRVELLVKGGDGKTLVVESLPPDVPTELKAK